MASSGVWFRLIFLGLVATIVGSGCTSVYQVEPLIEYPTHQSGFLKVKTYFDPIELTNDYDYLLAGSDTADPNLAKAARNRLQGRLKRTSDVICSQHQGDAFGLESNVSLILSVLTSALSGSAAVVPAILTKSALAAAGAFTNATGTAYNAKIYQNLFIGTILKASKKSRTEQDDLMTTRKQGSVTDYNVDDAVRDAQEYHLRCSFFAGVMLLSESIDKTQAPPSEAQILSRVKTLRDQIDTTDKQIAAILPDKRTTSNPDYSSLIATKFGLQRQVDAELLKLSAASLTTAPTASTTGDPTENLKKMQVKIAQAKFSLGHDGLFATITKAEVASDKKLHIDVSISTDKGSPSDDQMKTINDDNDLKDPLLKLGDGGTLGLSKGDIVINKVKSG